MGRELLEKSQRMKRQYQQPMALCRKTPDTEGLKAPSYFPIEETSCFSGDCNGYSIESIKLGVHKRFHRQSEIKIEAKGGFPWQSSG